MNGPLLLLFLREPVLGKVKTRLAAGLGEAEALSIYKRLLLHTLKEVSALEVSKQAWFSEACVGHDIAAPFGCETLVQTGQDLGERMLNAFAQGFSAGHSPIIIIGSDLPGISTQLINDAFAALKDHDAVLGPSVDGGYYLLGLNAPLDVLFKSKSWSTDTVFAHTMDDLVLHGRTCHLLPALRDVDTVEDLALVELP